MRQRDDRRLRDAEWRRECHNRRSGFPFWNSTPAGAARATPQRRPPEGGLCILECCFDQAARAAISAQDCSAKVATYSTIRQMVVGRSLAHAGAHTQAELVRIAVWLLRDFALRQQVDVEGS